MAKLTKEQKNKYKNYALIMLGLTIFLIIILASIFFQEMFLV